MTKFADSQLRSPADNIRLGTLAAVVAFYVGLHLVLRLPLSHLVLPYHDDGETLYHALSMRQGRIPYLHDISHHFMGYVVPFVVYGAIYGDVVPALIPWGYLINQVASAYGIFLCARYFVPTRFAVASGALLLSAREPWVLSFFPLYEINCLMIFAWYFYLRYTKGGSQVALLACGLICGTAFVVDQRAVLLVVLPVYGAFMGEQRHRWRWLCYTTLVYLTPLLLALSYLVTQGALEAFWEQTILYPVQFRSASAATISWTTRLWALHAPLVQETPLLLILALTGLLVLWRCARSEIPAMILFLVPVAGMPLLGGRSFDYYTIPWLPWLALLAACMPIVWRVNARLPRRLSLVLVASPSVLAVLVAIHRSMAPEPLSYDPIPAAAAFVKAQVDRIPGQSYIWGYRPDFYVYLGEPAPFRFVNRQLVHPDFAIQDPISRQAHIYPKYEQEFLRAFAAHPPQYLVTVESEPRLSSPADSAVRAALGSAYQELTRFAGREISGEDYTVVVSRLSPPD